MKLVVSRAALADIARLRDFLVVDPPVAQKAVATLDLAIQSLRTFRDRGRPCAEVVGSRELLVPFGRSAYVLRYAHSSEFAEIVILRVWHSREIRE